jgi:hypothetical protein
VNKTGLPKFLATLKATIITIGLNNSKANAAKILSTNCLISLVIESMIAILQSYYLNYNYSLLTEQTLTTRDFLRPV